MCVEAPTGWSVWEMEIEWLECEDVCGSSHRLECVGDGD